MGCPNERIIIIIIFILLWNHISEKQQKTVMTEVTEEDLNHIFGEYILLLLFVVFKCL